MQDARFYGTAPIGLKNKIIVKNGTLDSVGTLVIGELECLDSGIIWRGTLTPPGQRITLRAAEVKFPKYYVVMGVQIDCVRGETCFSLEEIADHTGT